MKEFNNLLTKIIETIVLKTSKRDITGFSITGKDFKNWGSKPINSKSGGNKARVSGILFLIKKSSNLDFVLFEIFEKINLKSRFAIIQKIKAINPIINTYVIASK